ncbi:tetratricopeptide repeat protein [Andreprevotia chitinilytica]|uniref:tetratricopeptide repeat protein n=1 Tax=Andreprevotia chitinilytica TaxID=396808 RepID=UPI000550566C|nr:tetratricopeptide repeat protein [Andreprevotia chitinilytica]
MPDAPPISNQVDQLLLDTISNHIAGDLTQAEATYRQILTVEPEQPVALHFLGVLLHQQGRSDEGIALVEQSITLCPDRAHWLNDLGNIQVALGDFEAAVDVFIRSLELKVDDPLTWNNLGATLKSLGKAEDAAVAFQNAIALDDQFADALDQYGQLLSEQGKDLEAADYFCRAYIARPAEGQPPQMRGIAFYRLGRYAEAAAVYQDWMQAEPGNPLAAHHFAACSGLDTAERRASDAYIEQTFDFAAAQFDQRLAGLGYRGPEYVGNALKQLGLPPQAALDVLDAGCGTGLCGVVLAPYARALTGVDLSGGMLERAQTTGRYHTLVKAGLGGFLVLHPQEYDLIVAADTLIYFGDLAEVLGGMAGALRAGGHVVLTFETLIPTASGQEYKLQPSGRYAHRPDYIEHCLRQAGFVETTARTEVIRIELGVPIAGVVVTAGMGRR